MKQKLKLYLYAWSLGNFLGIVFMLLRVTRRVEIKGYARSKVDPKGRGLLVICNHPSPTEPTLLPFLFYPWFLFQLRFVTYCLPARQYYDDWLCIPFRIISVPIDRASMRNNLNAVKELEGMLRDGKVILMHPERERIYSDSERDSDTRLSKSGKRMKRFRPGTRRLFMHPNCRVLPIWMDGGDRMILNRSENPTSRWVHWPRIWRKVTIKIGEPLDVTGMSKNEVLDYLEDVLLDLADREM